jgi:hypothetical protein
MSLPVFLQILANIVFAIGFVVVFARLRRPAKDDPRLSKGLQLLSSKIAVLEDLSDRTEHQVQQMLTLLDQKSKELQSKIALAEQQVMAVRQSMEQSLEVAQIFQDKIPHTEIIERQNSVKYIKAARLAHAGVSVADISKEVDLPLGEIEFIAKVNQENLSFREEDLPAWAREPQLDASGRADHAAMAASIDPQFEEQMPIPQSPLSPEQEGLVHRLNKLQFEMKNLDLELAHRSARNVMPDTTQAFESPRVDSTSLERLGEQFRRAVEAAEQSATNATRAASPTPQAPAPTNPPATSRVDSSAPSPVSPPETTHSQAHFPMPASAAPQTTAPPAVPTLAREVSIPELEAARAAAAALRGKEPVPAAKVVRRVEFPRI